ncbi:MAG: GNAT family N-acetyltransferase [Burkholderiales bacterium]|nr:GNAT family N-acetyltransferase [Phycisphaerae bacterium]
MSSMIQTNLPIPVPAPRAPINIRAATMDDLPFVDELQKKYRKNLGFSSMEMLKGKINLGQMIIAESAGEKLGYLIGQDRYFKRDDVGIVYHLVVKEARQRGFIGAALLKAQFDRSAYGCRLYCCWCAQDLEANRFWESMGFVPLAYRNGSETRGKNGAARVHIFWQKKIRGKDDHCNWWFPSKTDQGALRADRLVFPIPPGVRWREVKPIVLPGQSEVLKVESGEKKQLPGKRQHAVKPKIPPSLSAQCGFRGFASKIVPAIKEKPKKEPRKKATFDPKFVAAARELRDRYLEQVNDGGYALESAGKYDLVRQFAEVGLDGSPSAAVPLRIAA